MSKYPTETINDADKEHNRNLKNDAVERQAASYGKPSAGPNPLKAQALADATENKVKSLLAKAEANTPHNRYKRGE